MQGKITEDIKMYVQVVKLITGEEIIAVVSEKKDAVELTQPMLVAVQDNRLVFIPYMQYTTASEFIAVDKKLFDFDLTQNPNNFLL
jgi:hypothetical protein